MAIDINNFIFHSDYLVEQRTSTKEVTVTVPSGSIPSTSERVYASPWVESGHDEPYAKGLVTIPRTTYLPTVGSNRRWQLPLSRVYDSSNYINMTIEVQVSGTKWRCVVRVFNPYNFSISRPSGTYKFSVGIYMSEI